MRKFLYFCLFVAALVFLSVPRLRAEGGMNSTVRLRYLMNEGGGEQLTTFYVDKDKTVVERDDFVMVFDYKKLQLTVDEKDNTPCLTYPMKHTATVSPATDAAAQYRENMEAILGELEVTGLGQGDDGYFRVQLLWGMRANRHRTAGTPSVEMYGRRFTAGKGIVRVDKSSPFGAELRGIAKERATVFELNPLLNHMDILGLIDVVEGIPVWASSWGGAEMQLKDIERTGSGMPLSGMECH